ncbi:adenylate kinase family protein [Rhizobium leguminosarum]|uniref:adenylate kinase family protein n=1 Tax=Rhizobium leguminosarum TaxID=384 RepID=UPI003F9BD4D6
MRIILLGLPSAGIGTQAKMLSKRIGVPQLSPGEIRRESVAHNKPEGLKARIALQDGRLLDDDTMQTIVVERLAMPDVSRGFILHGFPETVRQAVAIDETLRQKKLGIHAVIELTVEHPMEVARDETNGAPPFRSTAPVANYYWNQQLLIMVDGMKDYRAMGQEICKALALEDIA